jgi:catechol 2,3-dioxygenase-like lactoylglutathione lyase family enzyme
LITGFDHVVIAVRDLSAGIQAYEALLDAQAEPVREHGGAATTLIATDNIAVELMAPAGNGEVADRLRATLDADGEGLKSLVFAVADIETMHRRFARVGLAPEEIAVHENWRSLRIGGAHTFGARLFCVERAAALAPTAAGVSGLDHIVLRTSDPERAAALYGARLGLDMRLDRQVMGRRLMFFRCGDAVLEIVHDPGAAVDRFWGLSWRVPDADSACARLAAAGLDVSEVRAGVKPGTRVFTVRDGTCGAPTLMLEPSRKAD